MIHAVIVVGVAFVFALVGYVAGVRVTARVAATLYAERVEFRRMESIEHRKAVLRDAGVRLSVPSEAITARVTQARLRRDGTNVYPR